MSRRSSRLSHSSSTLGSPPPSASSPEPKRRRTTETTSTSQDVPIDSRDLAKAKMGEPEGLEGRTNLLSDEKFRALNKALVVDKKKPQATQLKPEKVDFHIQENRNAHKTDYYEDENRLIIRRGQAFDATVTFNRQYKSDSDTIVLQFVTGSRPQESKGSISRAVVQDNYLDPAHWGVKISKVSGKTIRLTIMPSAKAIIGDYEVYVETKMVDTSGKALICKYKDNEKLCILFNAWCKEDQVYMDDEMERKEYVLADSGLIWVGSAKRHGGIPWTFGQFEEVSLESALWLLDKAGLSTAARSNPTQIVRTISAMANYNDRDGGVLFGRWTETYPKNCTPPSAWTGSVAILEKFWKKKYFVKYGQCWVFSGLVTTLLRALGLPTRSVTNFQSAHDNDGSMTIDFHFDEEGNPLHDLNDSVWNFHVWNESWFKRPDLPDGHDGWQAHDATPQETSEGVFRCGPASVNAVKKGEVYLPYDTGFIFAEVNGDRVYWQVDDADGSMIAYNKDTHSIGKYISTKDPGSDERLNVTGDYKYREGSREEREAVEFANKFSTRKEYDIYRADEEDVRFRFEVVDDISMGDNFEVKVVAENTSEFFRTAKVNITSIMAFYTGITAKPLKQKKETLRLGGMSEETVVLKIAAKDYLGKLAGDGNIKLYVKAKVDETNQSYVKQDIVEIIKPTISVTASPKAVKKGDDVEITASFKNPLSVPLTNGHFHFEATGMATKYEDVALTGSIASKKEAKATVSFTANRAQECTIVASFLSDQLAGVRGKCTVLVN
ncbi:protein-glutamine gamma-glutamyltransferase K-like [Acropora millepora]|uniref:protein-glutamine gamma-glutamyltransferase K-like n=1 Tax=Acropora millepora TaxID=45264 RepID=UPI001CF4F026|nr:protein-glutamine gamma-glutamyltransferase K-like [Acropora millepora]